jgi:hypothetical protein
MIESKDNILGSIGQFLDSYARQARLYPALIVVCPIALLIMVWFPTLWTTLGATMSVASSFGLALLLAQVARDRGKQREPDLFKSWGGKPSVVLLRHRDRRIDAQTKARYRAFLAEQLPQLKLPTAEEEQANPDEADGAYESVTRWLLTQTRDVKVFGLLFRENVNYGFRRNLWGLKSVGLTIAVIAGAASTGVMLYQFISEHTLPGTAIVTVTGLVWVLVVLWLLRFTPSWVRIPADEYGMQLLAACDTLNATRAKKRNAK